MKCHPNPNIFFAEENTKTNEMHNKGNIYTQKENIISDLWAQQCGEVNRGRFTAT